MKANGAKVAIVTGAGHGIGRACAVELSRQGWACVCANVDAARAEETAASAGGRAVACDVSKEEDEGRWSCGRDFLIGAGSGNRALEGAVRYYDQPPFPAHAYIAGRPVERKQELSQSRLLSEFA